MQARNRRAVKASIPIAGKSRAALRRNRLQAVFCFALRPPPANFIHVRRIQQQRDLLRAVLYTEPVPRVCVDCICNQAPMSGRFFQQATDDTGTQPNEKPGNRPGDRNIRWVIKRDH